MRVYIRSIRLILLFSFHSVSVFEWQFCFCMKSVCARECAPFCPRSPLSSRVRSATRCYAPTVCVCVCAELVLLISFFFSLCVQCWFVAMCMQSCCFLFIQIFIDDMKCIMQRDTKVICSNCTLYVCIQTNQQTQGAHE